MKTTYLEKIKLLLKNSKSEFKLNYGLELTNLMVGLVTGINKHTLDNLKNFKDDSLEKYYDKIKSVDFSFYVSQAFKDINKK